MAPECSGTKKKEGKFRVRVKCLCFHGNGCPRDPTPPPHQRQSKEVKGHRLQCRVQLSLRRPRHLAAVKSYFHRKRRRGGELHSFTAAAVVSLNPMLA